MSNILASAPRHLFDLAVMGQVDRAVPLVVLYAMPRTDDQVTFQDLAAVAAGYPFRLRPIELRRALKRLGGLVWQRSGGVRRVHRLALWEHASTSRVAVPQLPAWEIGCRPAREVVDELFDSVVAQMRDYRPSAPAERPERQQVEIDDAQKTRYLDRLDALRARRRQKLGLIPETRRDRMARRHKTDWRSRKAMNALQKLVALAVAQKNDLPKSNLLQLRKAFIDHAKTGKPLPLDTTPEHAAEVALGAHVLLASVVDYKSTAHEDLDLTAVRAVGRWLARVVTEDVPGSAEHEVEVAMIRRLAAGNPWQLLVDIVFVMHTAYVQGGWVRAFNFFTVGFESRVVQEAVPALARLADKRAWSGRSESPTTLQGVLDRLCEGGCFQFPAHPTHLRWNSTPEQIRKLEARRALQAERAEERAQLEAEAAQERAAMAAAAEAKASVPVEELLRQRAEYFGGELDLPARMAQAIKPDFSTVDDMMNWQFFERPDRKVFGDSGAWWRAKLIACLEQVRSIDDRLHAAGYDLSGEPSFGEHVRALFLADADSQDYVKWILTAGFKALGQVEIDPRTEWPLSYDHPAVSAGATQRRVG